MFVHLQMHCCLMSIGGGAAGRQIELSAAAATAAMAEGAERGWRGLDRDALLRTTQRDQPIGVQLR